MNASLNDKGTPDRVDNQNSQNHGHQGWYSGAKKVLANEGLVVDVAGQRLTWKARGEDTGYLFSIYEMTLLPEKALPLHYHPYAEVFYVLHGEVEFGSMKDGQEEWITCQAGETVVVGPDAVHGFRNSSGKPARFLSVSTQQHQQTNIKSISLIKSELKVSSDMRAPRNPQNVFVTALSTPFFMLS